jgi:hypothetical protein
MVSFQGITAKRFERRLRTQILQIRNLDPDPRIEFKKSSLVASGSGQSDQPDLVRNKTALQHLLRKKATQICETVP